MTITNNKQFQLDDKLIRNYRFHSKGYSLISIEPVTINGTLFGRCPNGHSFITTFVKFMKNHVCPECK